MRFGPLNVVAHILLQLRNELHHPLLVLLLARGSQDPLQSEPLLLLPFFHAHVEALPHLSLDARDQLADRRGDPVPVALVLMKAVHVCLHCGRHRVPILSPRQHCAKLTILCTGKIESILHAVIQANDKELMFVFCFTQIAEAVVEDDQAGSRVNLDGDLNDVAADACTERVSIGGSNLIEYPCHALSSTFLLTLNVSAGASLQAR